jgi:hypothetical protein
MIEKESKTALMQRREREPQAVAIWRRKRGELRSKV